jgi:hypothetical protein
LNKIIVVFDGKYKLVLICYSINYGAMSYKEIKPLYCKDIIGNESTLCGENGECFFFQNLEVPLTFIGRR